MPGASYDPAAEADKKIFRGVQFVLEGHFKDSKGEFMDHTTIARLIRTYGGEVDQNVNKKTNFLVCTIQSVKAHGRKVQRAVAMGKARCRIVAFDFITDSIIRLRDGKVRRQNKQYHEMENVLRRLKQASAAREIYNNTYYSQEAKSNRLVDGRTYHAYKDTTGFTYKVVLTREFVRLDKRGRPEVDALKAQRKRFEKYTLMLFESNAMPLTYQFGIHFNKPAQKTTTILEYLKDEDFTTQFKNFRNFFQKQTGIEWDKRFDNLTQPKTIEKATKKGFPKEDGETDAEDKRPFIYKAPERDQPRGVMPRGWIDPVQALLEKEERDKQVRLAKEAARMAKELEDEENAARERAERDKRVRELLREDEPCSDDGRSDGGWQPAHGDLDDSD